MVEKEPKGGYSQLPVIDGRNIRQSVRGKRLRKSCPSPPWALHCCCLQVEEEVASAASASAPAQSKVKALWSKGVKTAVGFGSVMKMFAPDKPKEAKPPEEEDSGQLLAPVKAAQKVGFGSSAVNNRVMDAAVSEAWASSPLWKGQRGGK